MMQWRRGCRYTLVRTTSGKVKQMHTSHRFPRKLLAITEILEWRIRTGRREAVGIRQGVGVECDGSAGDGEADIPATV